MNRREFVRSLSLGLLATGYLAGCRKQELRSKPNVVIMIADDTGWNDVGYHGSEIKTPFLDRLAKENVELDRFYVYPVCSPTRASLLGGRPPSRWGILAPIGGRSTQALPKETPTLAQLLKEAGYRTALAGKWHLGLRPEVGPKGYGFDSTYGFLHGQIDQYTHHYKNGDRSWHRNDEFIDEEGHATDLIRDEAVRIIREWGGDEQPFFLYVAFSVPHYPLQEPEEWIEPYRETIQNESRRLYAASMTHMDAAIGDILAALKEKGIERETLVIFLSDNGGQKQWFPTTEYGGKHGPNDRLGDNRPLRGWKGDLYEGGIRVPAAVAWPGRLAPRKVSETMIVYDLLPTIAALADIRLKPEWKYEGIDVWPALSGRGRLPQRFLYWRSKRQLAIRRDEWKLVHNGPTPQEGEDELYDVILDPLEKKNLIAEQPKIAQELRDELVRQFQMDA